MSPPNAFQMLRTRAAAQGCQNAHLPSARQVRPIDLAPRRSGMVVLNQQKSRAQALRTEQIKRGTLSAREQRRG
ncbi:MAG: hypothetical protein LT082_08775 [Comamonas sp.]|nr:hypothetical protein [Comamonas sp.]